MKQDVYTRVAEVGLAAIARHGDGTRLAILNAMIEKCKEDRLRALGGATKLEEIKA